MFTINKEYTFKSQINVMPIESITAFSSFKLVKFSAAERMQTMLCGCSKELPKIS